MHVRFVYELNSVRKRNDNDSNWYEKFNNRHLFSSRSRTSTKTRLSIRAYLTIKSTVWNCKGRWGEWDWLEQGKNNVRTREKWRQQVRKREREREEEPSGWPNYLKFGQFRTGRCRRFNICIVLPQPLYEKRNNRCMQKKIHSLYSVEEKRLRYIVALDILLHQSKERWSE